MKTILTVIGARPQFVKASVISRLIRSESWSKHFRELILHTGQHYDDNLSEVFFRQMAIPRPDFQLRVTESGHGGMTAQMLDGIEKVLLNHRPDMVLVYGDTNSTLAGALAAAKLQIPLVHVEAGLRSYDKKMPEEQNRVLTDHLSDWLFCPTKTAVDNLAREGLTRGVAAVGDVMLDASLYYRHQLHLSGLADATGLAALIPFNTAETPYVLATIHRAGNTDNPDILAQLVHIINNISMDVVLPLHPRTKQKMLDNGLFFQKHVHQLEPVGYLEMLWLEMNSKVIMTDSGGVQKEAYFLQKPCITLREETEWTETVESGWNTLAGCNKDKVLQTLENLSLPASHPDFYGDGKAGQKMLHILSELE